MTDAQEMTIGEIAEQLGVREHVIAYCVRSRRIPHKSRAGRLRIFSNDAVRQIREYVNRRPPCLTT